MTSMFAFLFRPFSAQRYFVAVLALALLAVSVVVTISYAANDFGLWRHRDSVRIWGLEKTSKYLLSHKYIPENFDGILIGPSVSANLDTRVIKDAKVYNLSMVGGNISEIGKAATLYIERATAPKVVIVCLYPYIVKDHGMKSYQIHEKEYLGSLFSIPAGVLWAYKLKAILKPQTDELRDSTAGMNNYELTTPKADLEKITSDQEKLPVLSATEIEKTVDPVAYAELKQLIDLARAKNMTVIGYYHPIFQPVYQRMRRTGEWDYFKDKMEQLFQPTDRVIDMNTAKYQSLRTAKELRIDEGHLSAAGSALLIEDLDRLTGIALRSRHER